MAERSDVVRRHAGPERGGTRRCVLAARPCDATLIPGWRSWWQANLLRLCQIYWRADARLEFCETELAAVPIGRRITQRWYGRNGQGELELKTKGAKFVNF